MKKVDYDFLFICPIDEEFKVFIRLCPIKSWDEIDGIPYYNVTLPNKDFKALVILLGEAGLTKAAQLTEKFLNAFSISMVVLIGIAGGIDSDLKLGDVVIPNRISDYLLDSKAIPKGKNYELQPSINAWNINPVLIEYIRHFRYQNKNIFEKWQKNINDFRQEIKADLKNRSPNYKIGHLASGNIVSGSASFKKELKLGDRKYLAIDMEAAGVARAVFSRSNPPLTLIIRGISDFSDRTKSTIERGINRKYAVYSAIGFLLALIESKRFKNFLGINKYDNPLTISEKNQEKPVAVLLKEVIKMNMKMSGIIFKVLEFLNSTSRKN